MASAGPEWVIQCYASSSALQMSEVECILHTYCKNESRPYFRCVAPASLLHFCFANRGLVCFRDRRRCDRRSRFDMVVSGWPHHRAQGNGTLELSNRYVWSKCGACACLYEHSIMRLELLVQRRAKCSARHSSYPKYSRSRFSTRVPVTIYGCLAARWFH